MGFALPIFALKSLWGRPSGSEATAQLGRSFCAQANEGMCVFHFWRRAQGTFFDQQEKHFLGGPPVFLEGDALSSVFD